MFFFVHSVYHFKKKSESHFLMKFIVLFQNASGSSTAESSFTAEDSQQCIELCTSNEDVDENYQELLTISPSDLVLEAVPTTSTQIFKEFSEPSTSSSSEYSSILLQPPLIASQKSHKRKLDDESLSDKENDDPLLNTVNYERPAKKVSGEASKLGKEKKENKLVSSLEKYMTMCEKHHEDNLKRQNERHEENLKKQNERNKILDDFLSRFLKLAEKE